MIKKGFITAAVLMLISLIFIWVSCTLTEGTKDDNGNGGSDSTCDEVVVNGCFNVGISGWDASGDTTIAENTTDAYYMGALSMDITSDNVNGRGFSSIGNVKNPGSNTKISFYIDGYISDNVGAKSGSISIKLGDNSYYNISGGIGSDITVDRSDTLSWDDWIGTKGTPKVTLYNIDQVTGLSSNDFELIVAPGADNGIGFVIDEIKFEE